MTHNDDITRAFSCANTTAFAVRIVEFEAVTHSFQHALGAIGDAEVAFVADTTRETPRGLSGVLEAHVYLVKCRATFLCGQRLALGNRLAFEQVQFHRIGADNFVPPDVDVTLCIGMSGDFNLFAAQDIVNLHGRSPAAADGTRNGALTCCEIADREHGRFQQTKQLFAFPDFRSFREYRQIGRLTQRKNDAMAGQVEIRIGDFPW